MKFPARRMISATLLLVLTTPLVAGEPSTAVDGLGRYVPNDVFLFVAKHHTEEREFVIKNWSRVYNALVASRIDLEMRNAIAKELTETERPDFLANWNTMADLCGEVDWPALVSEQVVVAERIKGLILDLIVVVRPDPAVVDANIDTLARILETVAKFDHDASEVTFSQRTDQGVRIWALDVNDAPIGCYLLERNGTIAFVFGKAGFVDVLDLMSDSPQGKSILESRRYQRALNKVPAPEHHIQFIDIDRLFRIVGAFPDMIMAKNEKLPDKARDVMSFVSSAIDQFDVLDYAVISGRMENRQDITYSYVRAKPTCTDKFLYKIIGTEQSVSDLQSYLPVETTSFSTSGFGDLQALHAFILDFMRKNIPDGESLVARWRTFQSDYGFDLDDDLLSWLGGQFIFMKVPPSTPRPFKDDETVLLIRVTDSDKARIKLDKWVENLSNSSNQFFALFSFGPTTKLGDEHFRIALHPVLASLNIQPCFGVSDGWLVIGSTENGVRLVLETRAGKHDSILKNERFRKEGISLEGDVSTANFRDMSKTGEELTAFLIGMGFAGASMPDSKETRPIKAVIRTMGSLGPVVNEINFFSSMSSVTMRRDHAWLTTTKITYRDASP